MKIRDITILSLIVLAVLTRLIPHPPNIAPITGIALFAGSRFDNKKMAFLSTNVMYVNFRYIFGV